MNVRQSLYKKNRLSGMSAYRAAVKAGYSHNTAINAVKNIEKRLDMKTFLMKKGLDDDTVAETLKNGLEATKKVSVYYESNVEGESKDSGYQVDEVADHPTRHKFLDTFLKLRGDVKEGNVQINNGIIVAMQTIQKGGVTLEYNIGG